MGEIRLRDFKTVDAANLLTTLAGKGWGRRSLQHAKSLLSGIFTYAKGISAWFGGRGGSGENDPRVALWGATVGFGRVCGCGGDPAGRGRGGLFAAGLAGFAIGPDTGTAC